MLAGLRIVLQGAFAEMIPALRRLSICENRCKRTVAGGTQVLVIPNHTAISKGTLLSIYKKARLYFPEETLRNHFYSE